VAECNHCRRKIHQYVRGNETVARKRVATSSEIIQAAIWYHSAGIQDIVH
jgi:hypothetical protein